MVLFGLSPLFSHETRPSSLLEANFTTVHNTSIRISGPPYLKPLFIVALLSYQPYNVFVTTLHAPLPTKQK